MEFVLEDANVEEWQLQPTGELFRRGRLMWQGELLTREENI